MLNNTRHFLSYSLTPERTLRYWTKNKKSNEGSPRKLLPRVCRKNSAKLSKTAKDSDCPLVPPKQKPFAPYVIPLYPSVTFCGPCFPCNSSCYTPFYQCGCSCNPSYCTYDPNYCTFKPGYCSCKPYYCTCDPCCCNVRCCPLYQPYYTRCPSSIRKICVNEPYYECEQWGPPCFPSCLPFCQEEIVEPKKPSEVIFMKKGQVVHENCRYVPAGADDPPCRAISAQSLFPLWWPPYQVKFICISYCSNHSWKNN